MELECSHSAGKMQLPPDKVPRASLCSGWGRGLGEQQPGLQLEGHRAFSAPILLNAVCSRVQPADDDCKATRGWDFGEEMRVVQGLVAPHFGGA